MIYNPAIQHYPEDDRFLSGSSQGFFVMSSQRILCHLLIRNKTLHLIFYNPLQLNKFATGMEILFPALVPFFPFPGQLPLGDECY